MEDLRKRLLKSTERISYLSQIRDGMDWGNLAGLQEKLDTVRNSFYDVPEEELEKQVCTLEEGLSFLEQRCEENLTPMERVRIVRSPLRFSLQDILENVYEDFSELGGQDEASIDPSMVAAKATIVRRVKNKNITQQVMVIGQEKGHGEEYRNGGCCKPWGNEKALRFMQVAQTEGIPIHSYIFTPGSFPVEDYPGAAQQIARNIYAMAKLRVPFISIISEGGSGGAEAIGLADFRMMFSHGYYSVISPEGAGAIEGKIQESEKIPKQLLEDCAKWLRITAEDNLKLGTIDRVVDEPLLGAKRDDFAFFKRVKFEMIRATDEVVLKTKSLRAFRAYELKLKKNEVVNSEDHLIEISWDLNNDEIKRLLQLRYRKYREMALGGFSGKPTAFSSFCQRMKEKSSKVYYTFRYDVLRSQHKQVKQVIKDVSGEGSVLLKQVSAPIAAAYDFISSKQDGRQTRPSVSNQQAMATEFGDTYTSPLANEDRTVSCPNAAKYGCKDLWVPDLYGEFCGVCETCGHHFPLEYEWYLKHLFDRDTIKEFNSEIASGNPLSVTGFEKRLEAAKAKTGRRSAIITFEARVVGVDLVVAMLYSDFRNGTVGSAEGEKFVQACEMAKLKRRPLLAYVHTTGGIRIQEGTLGVVQMPKCTMAVRQYVDSGGLYIVVYDNNSYAGPVASFLGCSHYQFAIRSSRVGFAGPKVIRDTTGEDIPPGYHSAKNALKRGHIQGIWDRREFRRNLHKALLTMGGRNLYYR
ncbi:MAG: acetyl-CoA carboxylase carboxyl transferase subunit alpha/beta [Proteobacteria bacterium]|nr:acetyl-CoA carboxylase carboxyl transferase subunit alpha/beta [Pseudomonadota bacterium]MBU4295928.1 acetyl-CoA carboxylase carboxyl transferase subunit alpha/beta [Pseudomonadota bacterium]MCG2746136.1 acetyl-CoA carboxylase carboxyl transferase subunit alpha/beta [Desulfobulbaceae bacterium]